ncbi:endonuclease NucS domain-containing protein [Salipaludibacillus sp. CF4.18]|uniref:endonuclease NucS domain-containing protein n=1 Tax=Salipaludibacillus sp. CF4.18 TaxID=3373081 RepID=UPI003EE63EAD
MNEAELTYGLINYSDLIEPGLTFKGREVNLAGKRCDLLFVDKDGKDLYVEVKKHVDVNGGGQLMSILNKGKELPETKQKKVLSVFEWI